MTSTPKIRVAFDLDEHGKPAYIESGGRKHYRIRFSVEGAPADAYAVTYRLHETYYNPVREVHRRTPGFTESTTSYGDYDVLAEVRGRGGLNTAVTSVGRGLRETYGPNPEPAIAVAISEIEAN